MSDDGTPDGPPTYSLASPGVVTTNQVKPFPDFEIHTFHLDAGRRLHTVRSYVGQHVHHAGMHAFSPVDWETTVPRGAQLFSVTAGVGAQTAEQFWMGWLKNGHAYLDALTEDDPVAASLDSKEAVIFPAVMDGSGVASLFTWKPAGSGVALVQRVFVKKKVTTRTAAEIAGHPLVSRATAVPGRTRAAVVGWIEQAGASSVLGVALVDGGRERVWRSQQVSGTAPVPAQRIGVWASAADRLEVTAVLVGKGASAGYRLARFSVRTGESHGVVKSAELDLKPHELVRAAIEYSGSFDQPESSEYFLLKDASLLGQSRRWGGPAIVRRSVPLDSPLPIVADYWIARKSDGSPDFEFLRP